MEWRMVPLSGFVISTQAEPGHARLRRTIFIAGGPLASMATLALIAGQAHWTWRVFSELEMVWTAALWANASLLACCLIPFAAPSQFGLLDLPSDSLSLWKLWTMPHTDPGIAIATTAVDAHVLREEGRLAEARALLEQEHARFPDSEAIANDLCVTMLIQDEPEQARMMLLSRLERTDLPRWLLPYILNNLAYADAMLGDPELLAEAERLIEEAIRLQGVHPTLLVTRACVFAQCGRAEESLRLLDLVDRDHVDPRTRAVRLGARGIALARLGRHEAALAELVRCRNLDPGGPWGKRLALELLPRGEGSTPPRC